MNTLSILYQRLLTSKIPYLMMGILFFAVSTQASIEVTNTTPATENCDGSIEITIAADAGYELAEPFTFEDNGVQVVPDIMEQSDNFFIFTINGLCAEQHQMTIMNIYGCRKDISVQLDCTFNLSADLSPACDGTTGSIALAEHPGAGSANYRWTDSSGNPIGNNSSVLENVPAGEYCVWVRNDADCMSEACFTLEEEAFSVEFEVDVVSGSIRPILLGGGALFYYHWAGPNGFDSALSSLTGVEPGSYYVEITDNNGCSTTGEVELCKQLAFEVMMIEPCPGQANGRICIIPNIEGASVQWANNGPLNNCYEDVASGDYAFKIYDSTCGQTIVDEVTLVNNYSHLEIAVVENQPSCDNESGRLCVEASGGVPPYVYEWNEMGLGEACLENVPADVFQTVKVKDACGQVSGAVAKVAKYEGPIISLIDALPFCGDANSSFGSAVVRVINGIEPFTFEWIHEDESSFVTTVPYHYALKKGKWTIIVEDACGTRYERTFEIIQGGEDNFVLSVNIMPSCSNGESGNGSISATVVGGNHPNQADYSFEWSSGATTSTAGNLAVGEHQVLVTSPEGCTKMFVYQVPYEAWGTISFETIPACNSYSPTGSITATPINFDHPNNSNYSFEWSNGATTATASGLSSGTYSVTVTNTEGCEIYRSDYIDRSLLSLEYELKSACRGENNGNIKVIPENGYPPYFYNWSNGASTAEVTNLSVGDYAVTVTDSKGCQVQENFLIQEDFITIVLEDIKYVETEEFYNTGRIEISVLSDVSDYSIMWSTGESTHNINNLEAGSYSVTVTTSNLTCEDTREFRIYNCEEYAIENVDVSVNTVTPLSTHDSDDGAISLNISNPSAGPIYIDWTSPTNSNFSSTESTISNLPEGVYCVTVRNGCSEESLCQRVAYCGDTGSTLTVTVGGEEEFCFIPSSPPMHVTMSFQNPNGLVTYNWSDGQIFENLSGSITRLFGYDGFVDFDRIITATDEATCVEVEIFDPSDFWPDVFEDWATKNLGIGVEADAKQYFQALGLIAEPYVYGCSRIADCNHLGLGNIPVSEVNGLNCQIGVEPPFDCSNMNSFPDQFRVKCASQGSEHVADLRKQAEYNSPATQGGNGCIRTTVYLYYDTFNNPFIFKKQRNATCDDSDGDGLEDDIDLCPYQAYSSVFGTMIGDLIDPDYDGLGNNCDNCPNSFNPLQIDCDNNGEGDVCQMEAIGGDCCQEIEETTWQRVLFDDATLSPCGGACCLFSEAICLETGLAIPDTKVWRECSALAPDNEDNRQFNLEVQKLTIQTIYPNPFNQNLNITLSSPKNQTLQVTLYDLLGRKIFQQAHKAQRGENTLSLELPVSLLDGIYFLEVQDEDGHREGRKVVHGNVVKTVDD